MWVAAGMSARQDYFHSLDLPGQRSAKFQAPAGYGQRGRSNSGGLGGGIRRTISDQPEPSSTRTARTSSASDGVVPSSTTSEPETAALLMKRSATEGDLLSPKQDLSPEPPEPEPEPEPEPDVGCDVAAGSGGKNKGLTVQMPEGDDGGEGLVPSSQRKGMLKGRGATATAASLRRSAAGVCAAMRVLPTADPKRRAHLTCLLGCSLRERGLLGPTAALGGFSRHPACLPSPCAGQASDHPALTTSELDPFYC